MTKRCIREFGCKLIFFNLLQGDVSALGCDRAYRICNPKNNHVDCRFGGDGAATCVNDKCVCSAGI